MCEHDWFEDGVTAITKTPVYRCSKCKAVCFIPPRPVEHVELKFTITEKGTTFEEAGVKE